MNLEETRNQLIKAYMGKHVHVVVDRPIGYQHGDITYPITLPPAALPGRSIFASGRWDMNPVLL